MMKNIEIEHIVDEVENFREMQFLARVAGLTIERSGRKHFTMIWGNGKRCAVNIRWDEALAVLRAILTE